MKSAYEIAQEITVDKNKPEHVELWNKVIKHEICGEIGISMTNEDSESKFLFDKV